MLGVHADSFISAFLASDAVQLGSRPPSALEPDAPRQLQATKEVRSYQAAKFAPQHKLSWQDDLDFVSSYSQLLQEPGVGCVHTRRRISQSQDCDRGTHSTPSQASLIQQELSPASHLVNAWASRNADTQGAFALHLQRSSCELANAQEDLHQVADNLCRLLPPCTAAKGLVLSNVNSCPKMPGKRKFDGSPERDFSKLQRPGIESSFGQLERSIDQACASPRGVLHANQNCHELQEQLTHLQKQLNGKVADLCKAEEYCRALHADMKQLQALASEKLAELSDAELHLSELVQHRCMAASQSSADKS